MKTAPAENDTKPAADAPLATEAPPPDVPEPAADASEATLRLKGIKLVDDRGQTGVFLKLSRNPDKVEHFTMTGPNRLVIDIHGPVEKGKSLDRKAVGDPRVARVRTATQEKRLRVIVDLKGKTPKYTVSDLQSMVVAFVGERSEKSTAQAKSQVLYSEGDAGGTATRLAAADVAPAPLRSSAPEPNGSNDDTFAAAGTGNQPGASLGSARPLARKTYSGQKISLDFKDADVLNVLRILAEVSGLNIVATDDVKGRVTVRLVDVPWDQALDIVLQANRLDAVRTGNVLRVSTITRLKEEREAQLAAEDAARELEPLKVAYIPVNYMKLGKGDPGRGAPPTDIKEVLKDVLSERGKVQVDERTNTVIVRDIQRGIDDARELITRLDLQTPEVLIESNIVEGTDTFQRDLGIQWGYSYAAAPQFGNATGREFPSSIFFGGGTTNGSAADPGTNLGRVGGTGPGVAQVPGGGFNSGPTIGAGGVPAVPIPFIADFPAQTVAQGEGSAFDIALGSIDGSKALDAKLTALERDGKGKIISRPKVVTLNNQLAKIEAIRIFRVRLPSTGTVISTGAGGVAGSQQSATEQIRTGITLEVKPQVSADGFILLEIHVKSSTADFTQVVDNIPSEVSREAISNVLIKDGETVVIGGVFRDDVENNESGIPYLRSIPGIGWLFKRWFRTNQREELLVFITPRIVKGGARIASLPNARELWDGRTQ